MLMRVAILYIMCLLTLGCKAQQSNTIPGDNTSKMDSLFTEVLSNLANRKDNIAQNGATICVPRFSNNGFEYLPDFFKDGRLKELPDSTQWLFIKDYSIRSASSKQAFNKNRVKKLLATKNVKLSESSGLRTGFTPFILNTERNRACVIYYDLFSNSPGTGVITNRIIAFYSYDEGQWRKVATLPLSLE